MRNHFPPFKPILSSLSIPRSPFRNKTSPWELTQRETDSEFGVVGDASAAEFGLCRVDGGSRKCA